MSQWFETTCTDWNLMDISRVNNINTINVGSLAGSLSVAQCQALNLGNFSGVIITSQLAEGILNDLNKFASDFRPITRVAALPALPNAAYPVNTVVLLRPLTETEKGLYLKAAAVGLLKMALGKAGVPMSILDLAIQLAYTAYRAARR